jgi:2-polyprenyl-6-methoxyphenol hydroxylase-like FAD-dependent oxidoreductase
MQWATLRILGYEEKGSKENLLQIFKGFDRRFLAILEQVDAESLKLWTLLDMDQLPTWINDKLALLGDAAHPLLPRMPPGNTITTNCHRSGARRRCCH